MSAHSLWQETSSPTDFPALQGKHAADVVVVGAGITGLTAAMLLSEAGKRVTVLEAARVGFGTSGHSTGNLYATVDQLLYRLRDKWSEDTARAVVESRAAAVDLIERTAGARGIDCGFVRRPWHLFAPQGASDASRSIEQEYQAASRAGLPARIVSELPLPVPIARALVIDNQAQFHPSRYLRGLARAIASERCRILERSHVTRIDGDNATVETEQGEVKGEAIVIATHTPVGVSVVQAELGPYREYAVAGRLQGTGPQGIFWSAAEPLSIRSFEDEGAHYLLVIGQKHKTGHGGDTAQYYHRLEEFARAHFPLQGIDHRWSAQHYRAADELPYIGRSPAEHNVYIGTGYATDGLVYGTLAGMLLTDEILGRHSAWTDLYKASRITPMKSARGFLKENLDVAQRYIKDYLVGPKKGRFEEVPTGEGRVLEVDGQKLAVYRDEHDQVHACSAVCTHLKCLVQWNPAERSWDCPCHGSRFGVDGAVLEGPALAPLKKVTRTED